MLLGEGQWKDNRKGNDNSKERNDWQLGEDGADGEGMEEKTLRGVV